MGHMDDWAPVRHHPVASGASSTRSLPLLKVVEPDNAPAHLLAWFGLDD
jgi:hypothetical protein